LLYLVILSERSESKDLSVNTGELFMEEQCYYVYMLSNWNNKLLYIGVTNNLARRLYEHKNKLVQGFTEKYNIEKLVYFETTSDIYAALTREKQLKNWRRNKKNGLINAINPDWNDLSNGLE